MSLATVANYRTELKKKRKKKAPDNITLVGMKHFTLTKVYYNHFGGSLTTTIAIYQIYIY